MALLDALRVAINTYQIGKFEVLIFIFELGWIKMAKSDGNAGSNTAGGLSQTDQMLLAALRRNARASISELAEQLGLSRSTVRAHLQQLQDSGELLGFTVILKGDAELLPIRGVMLIEIEGSSTSQIIRDLEGMPEVQTIHTTNGRWDLVVELGTRSLPVLDLVLRRIRLIDGIAKSETSLYLSTVQAGQRGAGRGRDAVGA